MGGHNPHSLEKEEEDASGWSRGWGPGQNDLVTTNPAQSRGLELNDL